jgi:hypothetical protein
LQASNIFSLNNVNGQPLPFKVLAQFPGFSAPALPRVNPGFNQVRTSLEMLKRDHMYLPFSRFVNNVFPIFI